VKDTFLRLIVVCECTELVEAHKSCVMCGTSAAVTELVQLSLMLIGRLLHQCSSDMQTRFIQLHG